MIKKEILISFIVLICISNVAAFAVASFYWSGNPIKLIPGETRNFSIILYAGNSDLKVKADVTGGSDVLKITDSSNIYSIPTMEKGKVNLEAIAPEDAKPGTVYNIRIEFSEVKDSEAGEFGFGTAIGQSFSIIVIPENPAGIINNSSAMIFLIVGIAVLLAAIFTAKKIARARRGKSKKKR